MIASYIELKETKGEKYLLYNQKHTKNKRVGRKGEEMKEEHK